MRQRLGQYIDYAITFLLFVVAGLTPLVFFNQMTEFYEMPKMVFLIVTTVLLIGLWLFSWIVKGRIVLTRTPLDWPLIVLLVIVLISTYLSSSRYEAIYGNFPRIHGSAVSWVVYILLYFVTVSHLKDLNKIKMFLNVLYGSAVVVAALTLLSFFHIFLPFDFAKAVNFTPTGSTFSTISFLMLLLPLPILSIITPNKFMPLPLAVVLTILFGATIALIGSVPSLVVLLIAFALCFFLSKPHQVRRTLPLFLVTVVVIGLTLVLAYVPFAGNSLQQLEANFPKEIQLPFVESWKVSVSAFRDSAFFGTGPSSYLFNFTTYKPAEFNVLPFWNFSFDTAYNEYLQVLGTLGIFGFLAIVYFAIVVIVNSWRNLAVDTQDARLDNTHVLLPAMAMSGLLSLVLFAIHASTLVSVVVTFFILAVLMMAQKSIRERVTELSLGIKASTVDNRQFDLFPVILFVIYVIAGVAVLYNTVVMTTADYYHRQALVTANTNGALTYKYLQQAESLNPQVDLYRVDMSQTNFALANAIAAQAKPGKDGTLNLSAQNKQAIQTLLSQSINEARVAVVLSPRSARNWEVLAAIYRNISGVAQNSLAFSLSAYGQAIQLDPLNPTLRLDVGGIYYVTKNYDQAIRFFTDAANLKPDYANAYYNLSIAYRDKGDLPDALAVANQTVVLLQANPNSSDYKTAVKLQGELKTANANAQKEAAGQKATAGQSNSALQNSNLPKVANLDNPPSVTPAPTVQPNPKAAVPQTSPSPAKKK
ncbi:MAG TPA: O-antigen ligase family protein [Candidatus Saccharimonadales bacterium]|nr:O-antigen ligase family protein [Candidatus Saccharimonadales bacterium]